MKKDEFNKLVKDYTLVDFYATWCGPCKMISPLVEEVCKESKVNLVKIDVDENEELARSYGVMSIPCLIIFENGKELKRNIGFIPKEDIIKFISK